MPRPASPSRRSDAETAPDDPGRRDRILDVAIRLAEEGGFENVRQRDVAQQARVALGTLYKRFRGKEELLSAALVRETEVLQKRVERTPPIGATPLERVTSLFDTMTRALCRKPNYARAVLKAMASGEPGIADHVHTYHSRISRMIVAALRGSSEVLAGDASATHEELALAAILQQVWFAALVGWSTRLHGIPRTIELVSLAARWLIAGSATGVPAAPARAR